MEGSNGCTRLGKVINGWTPPMVITEDNSIPVKPKEYLTPLKDEVALGNSHALNYIYNGVDCGTMCLHV